MEKQEFEMTEEQQKKLLESMQPVPMIMLQCGNPPSQQESANRAWERLGKEMGFQHMTVTPCSDKGGRFFRALPTASGEAKPEHVCNEPEFVVASDDVCPACTAGLPWHAPTESQ